MSKKTALIIPATIRSHALPSFYLADLLSGEYEIVYAVGSRMLEDLCIKNGFKCFTIGGFRVGIGMEERYIREKYGNVGLARLYRTYVSNELYNKRKEIYDRILLDWNPVLVIIDVFVSTEFFLINQYPNIKIAFFNPMPSIYNIAEEPGGYAESENNYSPELKTKLHYPWLKWLSNPRRSLMQFAQSLQSADLIKKGKLISDDMLIHSKFTLLFKDIPEIVLLPEEFEFKLGRAKEYQMYLGLCQRENRVDTELDDNFYAVWPNILGKKMDGSRIVYCSFGTFFEGADMRLLNFIKSLSIALYEFDDIHLICSVNQYVIEVLNNEHLDSNRISLFSRVPQTLILENASAFITHGGMGSIKESIYYEVPMLVFPLDFAYDQNDNALKVEYHQLGIRGVFHYERVDSIKMKLTEILNNNVYRNSLRKFKEVVDNKYTFKNVRYSMKQRFGI